MEKIFELIDEMKEQRKKIIDTWNEKTEIDNTLLVGWIEQNAELMIELAKKLDEVNTRLDELEKEVSK